MRRTNSSPIAVYFGEITIYLSGGINIFIRLYIKIMFFIALKFYKG